MDELHWSEYQVRTIITHDLQVKMATELRWFDWLLVSTAWSLQVVLEPGVEHSDFSGEFKLFSELCI